MLYNETYRAGRMMQKYTWQWIWRWNGPATAAVHVVINIYKWYNAVALWKLKTFLSTVTQKLIWNHSLQHEHWIILVPESSGIWHEQNIAMVFVDLTRFSLRLLRWTGNIVNCPLSKQWMSWCRWPSDETGTCQVGGHSCGKCNCKYSAVITTCLHLDVHEMNRDFLLFGG